MRSIPDLDDLVASVHKRAEGGEPLQRLTEAVQLGNELGARADALVDHFVSEARDAGLSWADIGGCLGVSKQAAEQQFVSPGRRHRHDRKDREGFERYTQRARKTVKASVRAAQAMGCSFVGTEHLLLGMLDLGEGIGPQVLESIQPLPAWREAVVAAVTVTPRRVRGRLPFTPLARTVMSQSWAEAVRLGHNYVGTEHQLLALIATSEGVASKVLTAHGAEYERVKGEIVTALAGLVAVAGAAAVEPTQPADPGPAEDA